MAAVFAIIIKQGEGAMSGLHDALHNNYGVCLWTVLAFVVFVIMVIVAFVHVYRQNKKDEEFTRELERKYGTRIDERR